MTEVSAETEWVRQTYFSDPGRQITLDAGQMMLDQNDPNERLYLLLEGQVVGYRQLADSEQFVRVFKSGPGAFVGMQSFFSRSYISSTRIIAAEKSTLAYIDRSVEAVEPEKYGSFVEQFMPLMVSELAKRTLQATERAAEKDEAQRRLFRTEKITTLGQLAAGIAHEMNNAIGVISRKTDYLCDFLERELLASKPSEHKFFRQGLEGDHLLTSAEMRKRVREYEREFEVSRQAARLLARIAPTAADAKVMSPRFLAKLDHFAPYWDLGRDVHDMKLSSRHAASIVKSVKVLGGGNFERSEGISVAESIKEALALLQSNTRSVNVELEIGDLVPIYGNMTELVQIWVNLIKNACDAMAAAKTEEPQVSVKSRRLRRHIQLCITDNGPGIPEDLQEKVFQPNFTTKKSGLQFGLGLGLAIVQRLVESYGGEIQLKSAPGKTAFKVKLPIENAYGKN